MAGYNQITVIVRQWVLLVFFSDKTIHHLAEFMTGTVNIHGADLWGFPVVLSGNYLNCRFSTDNDMQSICPSFV